MYYVRNGSYTSFVCLDFETTGLSCTNDRITEFGAMKVINGRLYERFSTLVNPHMKIPYRVASLTGITDKMVATAPDIETVLPAFIDYVGDLPLVAHNAHFDGRFLENALQSQGKCMNNPMDDTLAIAKLKCAGLPSYKLGFLTEHFQIPLNQAHRAWCDAEATAKLYLRLQEL